MQVLHQTQRFFPEFVQSFLCEPIAGQHILGADAGAQLSRIVFFGNDPEADGVGCADAQVRRIRVDGFQIKFQLLSGFDAEGGQIQLAREGQALLGRFDIQRGSAVAVAGQGLHQIDPPEFNIVLHLAGEGNSGVGGGQRERRWLGQGGPGRFVGENLLTQHIGLLVAGAPNVIDLHVESRRLHQPPLKTQLVGVDQFSRQGAGAGGWLERAQRYLAARQRAVAGDFQRHLRARQLRQRLAAGRKSARRFTAVPWRAQADMRSGDPRIQPHIDGVPAAARPAQRETELHGLHDILQALGIAPFRLLEAGGGMFFTVHARHQPHGVPDGGAGYVRFHVEIAAIHRLRLIRCDLETVTAVGWNIAFRVKDARPDHAGDVAG